MAERKGGIKKGHKIPPKKRTTLKQCEIALRKSGGFITHAAKSLNISTTALSRRISRSKKLQEVKKEVEEKYLDLAESKLIGKINKEDLGAICFFLKCRGKERGYIEKQIIDLNSKVTPKKIKELSEQEAAELYRDFMKKNTDG